MNIAVIIIRSLVGLLFIFSSLVYFLELVPVPPLEGNMKMFNDGLTASGYFMTLLKLTELVCGIALLSGFFVALALVIIAPVVINIFFVHSVLEPQGLPVAVVLVVLTAFLAYAYRKSYTQLFVPRAPIN